MFGKLVQRLVEPGASFFIECYSLQGIICRMPVDNWSFQSKDIKKTLRFLFHSNDGICVGTLVLKERGDRSRYDTITTVKV
jgi:hypothetical protein